MYLCTPCLSDALVSTLRKKKKPAEPVYPGPMPPSTHGVIGDFAAAEVAAVKAMAHFDRLRGFGDALWRDLGVEEMPRVVRAHHIAYEVLTEACKRLAYDRWLIEVR